MTLNRDELARLVNERIGGLSDAAAILGITDSALSMRILRGTLPDDLMPLPSNDLTKPRSFDLDAYRKYVNDGTQGE